jgi:hypothetical protein
MMSRAGDLTGKKRHIPGRQVIAAAGATQGSGGILLFKRAWLGNHLFRLLSFVFTTYTPFATRQIHNDTFYDASSVGW